MGRVGGREMQEGRDMGTYCICITDSLCYKAEANTHCKAIILQERCLKKKKANEVPHILYCSVN